MSREILFKAKRVDDGRWVEGFYTLSTNLAGEERCYIVRLGSYVWHEVDPSTVCQYTGLTDKNSKEIWEGDIVKINNEFYGTVIWHDDTAAFCISPDDDIHDFLLLSVYLEDYEVEVVGNVFDNPELLEQEG